MDCCDELLSQVDEKEQRKMWLNCLIELINKKSKNLTNLQFKNYKILTLAIWDDNFVEKYFNKSIKRNELNRDQKEIIISILRSKLIND